MATNDDETLRGGMHRAFEQTGLAMVWPRAPLPATLDMDGHVAALLAPLDRWLALYLAYAQGQLVALFRSKQFSVSAQSRTNLARSQIKEHRLRQHTVSHRQTMGPVSLRHACSNNIGMLHLSIQRGFRWSIGRLINELTGTPAFFHWMAHDGGTPPQPTSDAMATCLILHYGDTDVLCAMEAEQRRGVALWQTTIFDAVCGAWIEVYGTFCVRHNFYISLIFNDNKGLCSLDRDEEICRGILTIESAVALFIQTLGLLFLQRRAPLLASPNLQYFLLAVESLLAAA